PGKPLLKRAKSTPPVVEFTRTNGRMVLELAPAVTVLSSVGDGEELKPTVLLKPSRSAPWATRRRVAPALRARLVNVNPAWPVPLTMVRVELPAPSVRAPRLSVSGMLLAPWNTRLPPLRLIAAASLMRLLLVAP